MTKIKNYTSSVNAEKSISQIEKILSDMGAQSIVKDYEAGRIKGIRFAMGKPDGTVMVFDMPAKVEPLVKLFLPSRGRPTMIQQRNATEQAQRTAWKNIKEWVEIQATMIKLEQVEFMEVFMPYTYSLSEGKTFYEAWKGTGFKQLTK